MLHSLKITTELRNNWNITAVLRHSWKFMTELQHIWNIAPKLCHSLFFFPEYLSNSGSSKTEIFRLHYNTAEILLQITTQPNTELKYYNRYTPNWIITNMMYLYVHRIVTKMIYYYTVKVLQPNFTRDILWKN